MNLINKVCRACEGSEKPLDADRLKEYMGLVKGWELFEQGKKIKKEFKFKDFKGAVAFINRVANLAEKEKHHPDIFCYYSRVVLELWTHAIGGLHENDFILAAKIDLIKETEGYIDYEDFAKLDLRVGTILSAEKIDGADKLLKLSVDLGEESARTICAGVAEHYPKEFFIGRQVVVVANLAPRKMRGVESRGMTLMVSRGDLAPVLLCPIEPVPAGAKVK